MQQMGTYGHKLKEIFKKYQSVQKTTGSGIEFVFRHEPSSDIKAFLDGLKKTEGITWKVVPT